MAQQACPGDENRQGPALLDSSVSGRSWIVRRTAAVFQWLQCSCRNERVSRPVQKFFEPNVGASRLKADAVRTIDEGTQTTQSAAFSYPTTVGPRFGVDAGGSALNY
jgi:hypothetical protein